MILVPGNTTPSKAEQRRTFTVPFSTWICQGVYRAVLLLFHAFIYAVLVLLAYMRFHWNDDKCYAIQQLIRIYLNALEQWNGG